MVRSVYLNSRLSLIGGLYADKNQFFRPYAHRTFERFFNRQLNLENLDEITKILYETSNSKLSFEKFAQDFQTYANNQGQKDYSDADKEAEQDHIFGVPTTIVRGEPFWGNDRIPWIKKETRCTSIEKHIMFYFYLSNILTKKKLSTSKKFQSIGINNFILIICN